MTFFYFEFLPGFVVLMSETEVPVYCYWNGCIKYGTEGVYYEGSTPKKIIVNPKIALNRLLDEMHVLAGVDIDKERSKVKVFGRYPSVVGGQSTTFQYLLMPVVNSQSLETMLEVPSKHPCIRNVELYLEVIDHPGGSWKRQRTEVAVKVEKDYSNGGNMANKNSRSEEAAEVINLTGDKDSDSGVSDPCLSGLWLEDHDMRVGLLLMS